MNRLFLIDAYALIYRSYFAFINAPRVNSKGLNTSTMLGFVNTLEQLLKNENPTHIAVAFDMKGPTFRHDMFQDYKSQREEMPEDIRKSIPYIRKLIEAYNIPILEKEGFEADDVIGTLAKAYEKLISRSIWLRLTRITDNSSQRIFLSISPIIQVVESIYWVSIRSVKNIRSKIHHR